MHRNRKQERKTEATVRAEERAKLTDKQQLARLDKMFGKGKGAARERAKLAARMKADAAKPKAAKKDDQPAS
jgi:hypothetical protein